VDQAIRAESTDNGQDNDHTLSYSNTNPTTWTMMVTGNEQDSDLTLFRR